MVVERRRRIAALSLSILIAGLLVLNAWYVFWLAFGYGTIQLAGIPSKAHVEINGHAISVISAPLRLRPGTYRLVVSSPTITPYSRQLNIGLLQHVELNLTFSQRNPDAIASSLLGGIGAANAVHFVRAQWLDNNTWIVGTVTLPLEPGLALHYNSSTNTWVVAYFRSEGYPQNLQQLPADIASQIQSMEAGSVPG